MFLKEGAENPSTKRGNQSNEFEEVMQSLVKYVSCTFAYYRLEFGHVPNDSLLVWTSLLMAYFRQNFRQQKIIQQNGK